MEATDTTSKGYASIFWGKDCTQTVGTVSIDNRDGEKQEYTGAMMKALNINPGHAASVMT